jgi:putative flippase GtrA
LAARARTWWHGAFGQLVRFGIVGMAATLTHTGVFWLLWGPLALYHAPANILAFLVAFEVSFWGHRRWSFAAGTRRRGTRWRLFAVALLGLGLNMAWGWVAFDLMHAGLPAFVALQIGLTPAIVFVLSRLWVFRVG